MWVQVPSSARKTQVERLESFCVIKATFFRGYDKRVRDQSLNKRANMFCTENFNTPLSDRERKSALETWIKLIQPGETRKSVGCTWREGSAVAMSTRGKRYIRHLWEEQEKRRWKFKIDDISEG